MTTKQQTTQTSSDGIKDTVRDRYSSIARGERSGAEMIAEAFGYSAEQLASIPAEANLGVSCGNPTSMASLQPGEVVVDLGSGAGLDVFLAAQKVGPAGMVIGIDMTPDMIERARGNAEQAGIANVEFHLAEIESLPVADDSVDCVISNCVLNLVPDKSQTFAEIFRVLKPGGRLAISDIALKQPLPPEITDDMLAYVGCVAGAIAIEDYIAGLKAAGFDAVDVVDSGADLNAYAKLAEPSCCCSSSPEDQDVFQRFAELLERFDINGYAASVKVYAVKPHHESE